MKQAIINLTHPVVIQNEQRLHQLIDNVFEDYSKVLAVRLDLYIKEDSSEFNTYAFMSDMFIRLCNNRRYNPIFEHYITYAASLEYGQDRKWHYHVLFLFDGQRKQNGCFLAQQIGQYWIDVITRGIGDYNSPNIRPSRYNNFALGVIEHNDAIAIHNLKAVSSYLVKADKGLQHLPESELGKSYRTYRQGQYKPKQSNLGRPRTLKTN